MSIRIDKILWWTFGRNVVHGSDSPENGKREIGKASYTIQFNPNKCNKKDVNCKREYKS